MVDNKSHEFQGPVHGGEGRVLRQRHERADFGRFRRHQQHDLFIDDFGRTNPLMMPPPYAYQGTPSHYSAPTLNPDGTFRISWTRAYRATRLPTRIPASSRPPWGVG